ncbi:MAG TPA: hypothetical protein PKX48_11065 [Planctomycetota bacterium]|jgi:hypothetical protein|nr:hypothetical protein [Planctomycetota bacterium]OQC20637.1 MAG: hypothetical protein BWX69_01667 [Planctomycetes bacterium ADurb.Bin069]NMD37028.1 hypothetical protein [Planctomycetota bacterium]HNR98761.1 hypothetical protein [Planctomycetota bacterium]HNU25469.1 hypothetical protein [Planctomycetota bacterium]
MRKIIRMLVTAGALCLPGAVNADGLTFRLGIGGAGTFLDFELGSTRRARGHEPRRVWVPGHYEERVRCVEIPGRWREEWVPAQVRVVHIGRHARTEIVRPGHMRRVWEPPRTVCESERVWVPGYWRLEHGGHRR